MDPLISVIMPVGKDWTPYLIRNLVALGQQSIKRDQFEVIAVLDGFNKDYVKKYLSKININFDFKILEFIRSSHRNKGHRNHVRNKGCARARGKIYWILDCDHMPSPRALQGIVKCHATSLQRGVPAVMTFPTYSMALSPRRWLRASQDLLTNTPPKIWPNKINEMQICDNEFDGKVGHYKVGAPPKIINNILENSPAYPAFLWGLLGGYDNQFLAWGGNKQEFCRRLYGLKKSGLLDIWVIRDAMLVHQPHYKSSDKNHRNSIRQNERLFNQKEKDIHAHAEWWTKQVRKVSKFLQTHPEYGPRAKTLFVAQNPCCDIVKTINANRKHWEVFAINADDVPQGAINAKLPRHCSLGEKLLMAERLTKPFTIVCADVAEQPSLKKLTKAVQKCRKHGVYHNGSIFAAQGESIRLLGKNIVKANTYSELYTLIRSQEAPDTAATFKGSANISSHRFFHPPNCAKKIPISIGIITYNRVDMLDACLKSLELSMRPGLFDYQVYITDDGSTDGTIEWLEKHAPDYVQWDTHNRIGIAAQSNRVLAHYNNNVQYGFLCNDDIIFNKGWESHYVDAIKHTPYDHFVLMDLKHMGLTESAVPYKIEIHNGIPLVNWRKNRIQGAMLTFTQKVLDTVGGMDAKRFGFTNHEHVDWTIRNRRAGLAPGGPSWDAGCFDVLGGNNFIQLNKNNYRQAAPQTDKQYSQKQFDRIKNNSNRIYVPITTSGGMCG